MGLNKKIIPSFFIIIILCPVVIFYSLSIYQKVVQHQMEEKMEQTCLQTIVVKNGTFEWIKIGKEILVNGKMFDVKSYSDKGDEIVFQGLYDDDEKKILNEINDLVNNKKNSSLPTVDFLKIILMPSVVETSEDYIKKLFDSNMQVFFSYSESAVHQTSPIFIPPPNL